MARLITTFKYIICASTNYIQKNKPIKQPKDLLQHNCLVYDADPQGEHWTFELDEIEEVNVNGNLRSNNISLITQAVLGGMGVTRIPNYVVNYLRKDTHVNKHLIELFEEYTQNTIPIYAIYPSSIYGSPKIESFLNYLREYVNKDTR